ncbi:MAG TPA: HD domain-containing phosphohydrolase [Bryobacteraceae bacterium]
MPPNRVAFVSFLMAEVAAGLLVGGWEAGHWHTDNWSRFVGYLVVSLASARLKIRIPNVVATLSPTFILLILATLQLNLPEVVAISVCCALVQTVSKTGKFRLDQLAFNSSLSVLAPVAFHHGYELLRDSIPLVGVQLGLIVGGTLYFLVNTLIVARISSLESRVPFIPAWRSAYLWSYPYYLGGACVAGVCSVVADKLGWQYFLVLGPVAYLIYMGYNTYVGRIDDSRKHVEEVAALHLRTIESLALAIEAKDDTTHAHLRRVQTYALAIGEDLGMRGGEIEALRAAAILHDIGKLAVPEHIICKPGKLTPEEFEKMKIHPVVGAEILEHVKFPYPVAPIVRAHHEKWNGAGYPYGLKGEEIPLGARILAAVDCLDALASDRQYRRALPLDEAMKVVDADSGRSFDPAVVDVLKRRYVELEKAAVASCVDTVKLSKDIKIERGEAPAAGFESTAKAVALSETGSMRAMTAPEEAVDFLSAIASARHEVQELFELSQELGNSLSLAETLSLVASRMKRLIPHEAIALYVQKDGKLEAEYVQGENAKLFQSLRIPLGEGLAGWVAQHERAIINGNPAVEPGYLNDPSKFTNLRSALAIPLNGVNGFVGVLALYRSEKDAFRKDHLRILQAIGSKLAVSVENARKFLVAESLSATDELTGLPNLKSMFVRFDAELARSKRVEAGLTVLVCDLNGFKSINDRLGQLTGNRVLKAMADGLREICREYDMVARLGGDEFVIILPEMVAEAADVKIRQIEQLVARIGEETGVKDSGTILTASVGEATFPSDGQTVEDLLSEADRRMYLAKRKPRLLRVPVPIEPRLPSLHLVAKPQPSEAAPQVSRI